MTSPVTPPKSLLRPIGRALVEFKMIRQGDRVLLGLSGGKDSLTLLHTLLHFKRHAPVSFELGAVTVDPQMENFDPSPLLEYMRALGVEYHVRSEPIEAMARQHMDKDSFCAFCARMKRGIMYATARSEGFNVLALAQHLDDMAESFLMSAFFGGQLRTMKAHYVIDAGDLRVIRPMVYARETQTAAFAHDSCLPVVSETCPACFTRPTQRERMKDLLSREEESNPQIFKSLLTAMHPLIRVGMDSDASTSADASNPMPPRSPAPRPETDDSAPAGIRKA